MGPSVADPRLLASALEALAAQRPRLRDAQVAPLGAGLDHRAVRVGDLVVRLAGAPDADLTREAAVLALVARRCDVPVPVPIAATARWIAYPLLPGEPLLTVAPAWRARHAPRVAATLGRVLARLWTTPPSTVDGLVDDDATPLAAWRDEAAQAATRLAGEIPRAILPALRRFLGAPLPTEAPTRVLSHADLGCEHVLVAPHDGAVTGIVDWSDAAVVDPAKDLGLVLRDLGAAAHATAAAAAVPRLPRPDDPTERARLYAVCLALEDLAFGLDAGRPAYASSARAALRRLLGDAP